MLADNKIASNAGWDREILATEFTGLQIALSDINLDLDITGFEAPEVDAILFDFSEVSPNSADDIPEVEPKAIAKSGDLFALGNHRLIVGDARDPEAYSRLA